MGLDRLGEGPFRVIEIFDAQHSAPGGLVGDALDLIEDTTVCACCGYKGLVNRVLVHQSNAGKYHIVGLSCAQKAAKAAGAVNEVLAGLKEKKRLYNVRKKRAKERRAHYESAPVDLLCSLLTEATVSKTLHSILHSDDPKKGLTDLDEDECAYIDVRGATISDTSAETFENELTEEQLGWLLADIPALKDLQDGQVAVTSTGHYVRREQVRESGYYGQWKLGWASHGKGAAAKKILGIKN